MKTKAIYILGSGGFAKEVFKLIKQIGIEQIGGFVDVKFGKDIIIGDDQVKVISEYEFLERETPETAELAIGIGDPKLIKKLAIKFNKFYFPNIIHPSAVIDEKSIKLGVGNIITAGVVLTTCILIGNFNILNLSSTVGHDTIIGNYNVINPAVNISGGVIIGDMNLIGVGAVILQYKNIGNNNIVGASSLVTKDLAENEVVVGIPAKFMKSNL